MIWMHIVLSILMYSGGYYDRNANQWYAWLCKTHIAVDTCNDCNINDLKFEDVLNLLSYYEIQSENRYDYFLDCD